MSLYSGMNPTVTAAHKPVDSMHLLRLAVKGQSRLESSAPEKQTGAARDQIYGVVWPQQAQT